MGDVLVPFRKVFSEEDLNFTKNALIKSNARRFETQSSLLGMLQEMSNYGLSPNYIEDEEAVIKNMTLEQHRALANKYLDESKMAYLVVGDATTQYPQFKKMGFDEVLLVDKNGDEIKMEDVKQ